MELMAVASLNVFVCVWWLFEPTGQKSPDKDLYLMGHIVDFVLEYECFFKV